MTDPAGNSTGPYGLLRQFLFGGARKNEFKQNDPYTTAMKEHPAVIDARTQAKYDIALDCLLSCNSQAHSKISYSLGKNSFFTNTLDFMGVMTGVLTGGLIGKRPDYGIIGSFSNASKWEVDSVSCAAGEAEVKMHIENSMSASSGSRYSYANSNDTLLSNNPFGSDGALGTTKQSWDWEESVSFPPITECDSEE